MQSFARPVLRSGLVLSALATALIAVPAAAQRQFFMDGVCDTLSACGGGPCATGTHMAMLSLIDGTGCFCVPDSFTAGDVPPLCCGSATGATLACNLSSTCVSLTDVDGGAICVPNVGIEACPGLTDTLTTDVIVACLTTPAGVATTHWSEGDCDRDGVPNGLEASDPLRNVCVADDIGLCFELGDFPIGQCCTLSDNQAACCVDNGADMASCCSFAESPYACCHDITGMVDSCCAYDPTGIDCGGEDAGFFPGDDAGVVEPSDAGGEPFDAGPAPERVTFGGGGGAVCTAGPARTPAPLALLAVAFGAIALVVTRRRR